MLLSFADTTFSFYETGWEDRNGKALPMDRQSESYKFLCAKLDPDNDGKDECWTDLETGAVNYVEMDVRNAAIRQT